MYMSVHLHFFIFELCAHFSKNFISIHVLGYNHMANEYLNVEKKGGDNSFLSLLQIVMDYWNKFCNIERINVLALVYGELFQIWWIYMKSFYFSHYLMYFLISNIHTLNKQSQWFSIHGFFYYLIIIIWFSLPSIENCFQFI